LLSSVGFNKIVKQAGCLQYKVNKDWKTTGFFEKKRLPSQIRLLSGGGWLPNRTMTQARPSEPLQAKAEYTRFMKFRFFRSFTRTFV
jgi:hypothetical protein